MQSYHNHKRKNGLENSPDTQVQQQDTNMLDLDDLDTPIPAQFAGFLRAQPSPLLSASVYPDNLARVDAKQSSFNYQAVAQPLLSETTPNTKKAKTVSSSEEKPKNKSKEARKKTTEKSKRRKNNFPQVPAYMSSFGNNSTNPLGDLSAPHIQFTVPANNRSSYFTSSYSQSTAFPIRDSIQTDDCLDLDQGAIIKLGNIC